MWQLGQQDRLHHRDQEIPPIEETRSLPPLSPAGPSPGVSVLPSPPPPPSLSRAHLTSVTSAWSLVASSRFGSGDLPGMGGVSADSSPGMGRGEPFISRPSGSGVPPPSPGSQISLYIRTKLLCHLTTTGPASSGQEPLGDPSTPSPCLYPSLGESLIKHFHHSL